MNCFNVIITEKLPFGSSVFWNGRPALDLLILSEAGLGPVLLSTFYGTSVCEKLHKQHP